MKHFPGLGLATVSTDEAVVRIGASRARLVRGLLPYQVALRRTLRPVVMLSTAIYPALDDRAAAWSWPIIHGLLRNRLGFHGVTMTDSLDTAAAARGLTDPVLALRGAEAGADRLPGDQQGRLQPPARGRPGGHDPALAPDRVLRPHPGPQGPALAAGQRGRRRSRQTSGRAMNRNGTSVVPRPRETTTVVSGSSYTPSS
jgi:hypothetical protein